MQRVRVKIEGLRDPSTALAIAQMGADAIGLVFADSPRRVSPEQAQQITAALPPWVATVGVFVNESVDSINRTVKSAGIQYVQLHGDEPPETVAQVNAPCIRAFRIRDENSLREVHRWVEAVKSRSNLAAVLLDAFNPKARGGTGERFNWNLVAQARTGGELAGLEPIILAGGLDPACVAQAIAVVKPWAVDVASGVESSPGVKDMIKVRDFISAAQQAGELKSDFWK